MAKAESQRDGDLAGGDGISAMTRLFHIIRPTGGRRWSRSPPQQHLPVVLEEAVAGQQRHRRRRHGLGRVGRGDEGDQIGKATVARQHAASRMTDAKDRQERAVLDHQYCTFRSM